MNAPPAWDKKAGPMTPRPRSRHAAALLVTTALVACSSSGSAPDAPAPRPADATPEPPVTAAPPAPSDPVASHPACEGGVTSTCTAWNTRARCVVAPEGRRWVEETCAGGCEGGRCVVGACADECALGDSGASGTCKLWDAAANAWVAASPATSLHDRARDYDRLLRARFLPHGQVTNVTYTDATLTVPRTYDGYRDAAIWTGSALAAQAFRLTRTRSPDAERQVQALARTLHRNFEVTGAPGYPARFVMPAGDPIPLTSPPRTCDGTNDWHCGKTWDWVGGTSRDQYTGIMLGYLGAYLATTDEATRAIVRRDVVAVAKELAKKRTVPVRAWVDKVRIDVNVELENVILAPAEMDDGRVVIDIATGNVTDAGMNGMRDFLPDFSVLVKQILGFSPKIPRESSAMMIGAFFEMALRMAEDDPAMVQDRAALEAYYFAHAQDWLDLASKWRFATRDGCGTGYFSTHLAYIMAWAWASLAKSPAIAPRIRDEVLDGRLWRAVAHHKNPYFAFLWASTRGTPDADAVSGAAEQLGQFTPGPRLAVPRDARAETRYQPMESRCAEPMTQMDTKAVDVKDRRVDDFLWQRQPWQLVDAGQENHVFPGVDFLVAYWAGRAPGLLEDDRPTTCARWARDAAP